MAVDDRNVLTDTPGGEIQRFAPNLSVYVLPPDTVCLYSEHRKFFSARQALLRARPAGSPHQDFDGTRKGCCSYPGGEGRPDIRPARTISPRGNVLHSVDRETMRGGGLHSRYGLLRRPRCP
jgi:hypothetical protein